ncbi:MAG: lysophospholipid acyltransferase family protein [Candidatus Hodarchaeales archaeon]|jgi:1-acyl-sn-glycerol-3-phosphate acyltransferase
MKIRRKVFLHVYALPIAPTIFNVLYKIKIIDKHHVPRKGPFIIMSNHLSHFDAFFVAVCCLPRVIRPFFAPADAKLWKSPIFKVLLEGFNAIPIFKLKSGEKHASNVVKYMIEVIRSGENIIYFPEGARSKDGKLQKGKIGTGWLAHETKVPIIPCALKNTDLAMPVGRGINLGGGPRRMKLLMKFGPPVNLKEYYKLEKGPEPSRLITDMIMADIKALVDSY